MPDHVVPLLARGASELADELVAAGLWKRTRGGYRFHDWADRNPTEEEATTQRSRKSSGGTLGNHRRWHVDRGVINADCPFCQDERASPPDRSTDRSTDRGSESGPNPPSRPVPSDLYSRRPGNSHQARHESPDDDIEMPNGYEQPPAEVWPLVARLKLDRLSPAKRRTIDSETAYMNGIEANAPAELGPLAVRWWNGYAGITPQRLAQCLVDGSPPRDLPFSLPEEAHAP